MKFPVARFRFLAHLALLCTLALPWRVEAFETRLDVRPAAPTLEKNLAAASSLLVLAQENKLAPQDIMAAARAEYGRLLGVLYENGYFGPVISIKLDGREAADIGPFERLSNIRNAQITVRPGRPFRLGVATVAPLAPGTELPSEFRPGAPARTSLVREATRAGVDGWRKVGHAKARIAAQDISADHAAARLDVAVALDPGPLVRFGKLRQTSPSAVRARRVRQIAAIPTGLTFDPEILKRAATRLRNTGAFASVSLTEAPELGPENTMDIELALADAKPRRFGFGAELLSQEGVTLSGFWMHRNLLGGAERLRVEGAVSGLGGETAGTDARLGLALTRPATFGADSDLFARAEMEQLDEPLYFSRKATATLGISRYISDSLSGDAAFEYQFSDVRDGLGTRQLAFFALPVSANWDRRDNALDPTMGSFVSAEIMPFYGLKQTGSGTRGYLDARAYRSLGADAKVVLAGRLQLGTVIGSGIGATPPDMLFLSGGSGTVRGQAYQSLSVPVGTSRSGGRSFLGLAGEFRFRLSDALSAVAFYDAGYVGANSWIDATGGWQSGAGLGLRYDTGIGPIRLDLAAPVSGGGGGLKIYLGIGQAF